MVKNLQVGMTERGKIKIGVKGKAMQSKAGNTFQPPQKLDHFLITGMDRDANDNFVTDTRIMKSIAGETGQDATRLQKIPIRLLFDDIALNFQSSYAAFNGRKLWCRGDGETAQREGQTVECACERLDQSYAGKDKCKINGRLQVMIDGANTVGGVWMFRTTSWNTVTGLYSSMAFIQSATGGKLAGIPLNLTIGPKQVTAPDGKQMTAYIVGIEYPGTLEELRDKSYAAMLEEEKHSARVEMIHDQALRMIAAPVISHEDEEDVADEFYPPETDTAAVMSEPKRARDLAAELAAQAQADASAEPEPERPTPEAPEIHVPFWSPRTEQVETMPLEQASAIYRKAIAHHERKGEPTAIERLRDENAEVWADRYAPELGQEAKAALGRLAE
jgi:hypothetical protein